jgi:serine/threonine protein kinase
MHDEYHHPVVAKKELKKLESWSDEVFKEAAEREAVVLKTMLQFSHEHFIKTIAYCEVGEMEKYFLFPWAEDGNLKQYWDNQTPRLDEVYLKWVFSQLTGLAGAIHQLHEEGLCRHGDIKPQNILCFKDMGTGAINCRLVIADLGLAKVHAEATALRNGATTTMSHTVMYSAPEAEFNIQPRSRLYDVWSIGCTYLEFVIWLLWRKPQLDQFQLEIGGYDHRGTFYDTDLSQKPPYRINSRVKKWIKDLQNDPRCSEDTALRRLIDLIATRLLIVRLPETKESSSPPVDTQGPLKVLARQATTLEPSSLEPIRATAEEMHNRLRSISTDIEANRCKFMDDSKSEGEPPQFRPTLTLPTRNVHAAGIGIRKLAVR